MIFNVFLGVFWAGVFLYLLSQVKERVEGSLPKSTYKIQIEQYYRLQERLSATYKNAQTLQVPFHQLLAFYYGQGNYFVKNNMLLDEQNMSWMEENTDIRGIYIQFDYWQNWTDERLDKEIQRKILQLKHKPQNIIFENSYKAVLIQDSTEVMRIDMKNWSDLHKVLSLFVQKLAK